MGALRGLLCGITPAREREGVGLAQTQSVRTRVAQAQHPALEETGRGGHAGAPPCAAVDLSHLPQVRGLTSELGC